ncbi:MAG: hypothetical protein MI700_13205 [Balneolales bacterium]|nr:hypothetical protein [Balneolales bacterium]
MNKEEYQQLIADYLAGTLTSEQQKQMEELLASGEIDFIDFKAMEQLHEQMDLVYVPEPTAEMSARFYAMLEKEKEASSGKAILNIVHWLRSALEYVTFPRLAYAFSFMVIGAFAGNWLGPNHDRIEQLTNEVQTMQQVMMVSMLEGPSTTDRLRAVNISAQLPEVDETAIQALLFTLNNDPSVNVRVQSIEALARWGDNPLVREGLVRSIIFQESDIVIVTLADAMVELGVSNAAQEFQRLINEKELAGVTKNKVESTIAAL